MPEPFILLLSIDNHTWSVLAMFHERSACEAIGALIRTAWGFDTLCRVMPAA
jgi:HD-like signal output (HDOD) protein